MTYMLGMFGGGLLAAEPPLHPLHPAEQLGLGVAQFSALFVLLLISALVKLYSPNKGRSVWIAVAILGFSAFVGSFWLYGAHLQRHSIEVTGLAPGTVVAVGMEYTEFGAQQKKEHPQYTNARLFELAGGLDFVTYIWPEESINRSRNRFVRLYIVLLSGIATALFALTEGVLTPKPEAPEEPDPVDP